VRVTRSVSFVAVRRKPVVLREGYLRHGKWRSRQGPRTFGIGLINRIDPR